MSTGNQQEHRLSWEGCYNARDTGGYPTLDGGITPWGKLVRSDTLNSLTPEAQTALCEYGVRTIIDIRHAYELETHPDPFATRQEPGDIPRYLHLPIHDPEIDEEVSPPVEPVDAYIRILEKSKEAIALIVKAIASGLEEGCVLVHCQGGKDRTGILVALLLSLAAVRREAIVEDYALSEAMLEPLYLQWVEEQVRATGKQPDKPKYMQARPETMYGVLDHLDRAYGGVDGYLLVSGVTRAEIEQIRDHLTLPGHHSG